MNLKKETLAALALSALAALSGCGGRSGGKPDKPTDGDLAELLGDSLSAVRERRLGYICAEFKVESNDPEDVSGEKEVRERLGTELARVSSSGPGALCGSFDGDMTVYAVADCGEAVVFRNRKRIRLPLDEEIPKILMKMKAAVARARAENPGCEIAAGVFAAEETKKTADPRLSGPDLATDTSFAEVRETARTLLKRGGASVGMPESLTERLGDEAAFPKQEILKTKRGVVRARTNDF